MTKIVDIKMDVKGEKDFLKQIDNLDNGCLMAQEIAQYAAIHAIETLLKYGCSENNAVSMLHGLRLQSSWFQKK